MMNGLMDLEHARKIKILKQQMQEIVKNPYIEILDDFVHNCAVYPLSAERLISVKYNPTLKMYAVEIESSEEDVVKIIDLIRGMEK